MFHPLPPQVPPAIIQKVAAQNTAQATGIRFQIARTPTSKETNPVASSSTPAPPKTFLLQDAKSNLYPLLVEREPGSAAQLGPPLSTNTIPNEWEKSQFENPDRSTHNSENFDLILYPDNSDRSTFQLQPSLDRANSNLAPATPKADNPDPPLAVNSDRLTPAQKPATPEAESLPIPKAPSLIAEVPEGFSTFLVGIKVNNRNVVTSILVRGQEDGEKAIDFEKWLLPYETVVQALKLTTKVLPDNQIELRSPAQVIRLKPDQLKTDSQLGLVLAVADLRTLFGIEIQFEILDYAVAIQAPWLNQRSQSQRREQIVQTEGLSRIAPLGFSIAAVEQRLDVSGTESNSSNYTGNLSAVGSLFGGSWYIRANQPQLFSTPTWSLTEARYQRQTKVADYIVGSQPTFWRSQSGGNYWGFTTIQRQGFIPQFQAYGASDPLQRLNAAQMERTISGEAEPGTLVRLVEGFSDRAIAEVLVDSSGIYRFEGIESNSQSGNNYRIFLYPRGQLTQTPEIRSASFSSLPGQIPTGSSVYVVSGGWRQLPGLDGKPLGNFTDFQGGVLGRWGVSNSLTLGAGVVYDKSVRGVGELFLQPDGLPLKAAVSVLTGTENSDWDINANVLYEPSRHFTARLASDRFGTRLNAYWQLSPGLSLLGSASTNEAAEMGVQLVWSGKNSFTFARATFDTQSRFRWNFIQRFNQFQLRLLGNEITTQSALSYNFSKSFSTGHALVLSYDTHSKQSDHLTSLTWRYTSEQKSRDGSSLWDAQLGYGLGSRGSGLVAAVGTSILPGLRIQARYQGVSVTSNESSFSLNIVSGFNLQQGLSAGNLQAEDFRTQGGLLIQPFLDRNQNGRRDPGERYYIDLDLLMVNNQAPGSFRAEKKSDRILMHLPPGTYRLDLDPVGFPVGWQTIEDAYAVDVVAGSYTTVLVPLVESYTVSGIATNNQGQPLAGARVEAVQSPSGRRSFSITNDAGVYYLERLQKGNYSFQIDGQSASPNAIELQGRSETFQELNLKKF